MDERDEQRLLQWYEELSDDEHDPYSDDGEFGGDSDYVPSASSSSESGEDNSLPDENIEAEMLANDEELVLAENQVPEQDVNQNDVWEEVTSDIPNFQFDISQSGVKIDGIENMSPINVFEQIWDQNVIDLILTSTNNYGKNLYHTNRPKTRHSRFCEFKPISERELKLFLGSCLLQGHLKVPVIRQLFTHNPLYYHPIFLHCLSGRRFEQILRCLSVNHNDNDPNDRLGKVRGLLDLIIRNCNSVFSPPEALSLDESMLLFRGRLVFRQYIKNKKSKYGIKFYELTSHDGYILNLEIYQGRDKDQPDPENNSKTEQLVFRLMGPYLNKGHHIYMDNFYNSVSLSSKLLRHKTHTTGTLRANRRGNPSIVVKTKLHKGEHIWRKKKNESVYVSKWKDKRDVIAITTGYKPVMVTVRNKYGIEKEKPMEIDAYNRHMSGIDKSDQMLSYYSCPRKTIRWYKKVIFRFLDIAMWNSYLLYTKSVKKIKFIEFRESVIL